MRPVGLVLVAYLSCGGASAQGAPAPAAAPPKEVSPVTVSPKTDPPRVSATFPSAGEAIRPGLLVLKVSFDQKMLETGFDFAAAPAGERPDCLKTPRLLDDQKTFVLLCRVGAGKAYALNLNAGAGGGFANIAGQRAHPASLAFQTTTDDPVRTLKDAMKAANLGDADSPIKVTPGLSESGGP